MTLRYVTVFQAIYIPALRIRHEPTQILLQTSRIWVIYS